MNLAILPPSPELNPAGGVPIWALPLEDTLSFFPWRVFPSLQAPPRSSPPPPRYFFWPWEMAMAVLFLEASEA